MSKRRFEVLAVTVLAVLGFAVFPSPAHAGAVTLTLTGGTGSPGNTITIEGTITNDTSDTVYLNGESFNLGSASFLNGDNTDFFLNSPFSLEPGESSGLFALFTFDIAPGTLGGDYAGNFIDIIGGTTSGDYTDVLTSSAFAVNVNGVVPAPEPSSLILLLSGMLILCAWRAGRHYQLAR